MNHLKLEDNVILDSTTKIDINNFEQILRQQAQNPIQHTPYHNTKLISIFPFNFSINRNNASITPSLKNSTDDFKLTSSIFSLTQMEEIKCKGNREIESYQFTKMEFEMELLLSLNK